MEPFDSKFHFELEPFDSKPAIIQIIFITIRQFFVNDSLKYKNTSNSFKKVYID